MGNKHKHISILRKFKRADRFRFPLGGLTGLTGYSTQLTQFCEASVGATLVK